MCAEVPCNGRGGALTEDGSPSWCEQEPGAEGPEPEAEPPDPAPDIQKTDKSGAGGESLMEECTGAVALNVPASEAGTGAVATSSPASEACERRGVTKTGKEPPYHGRVEPKAHDPGVGGQAHGSARAKAHGHT